MNLMINPRCPAQRRVLLLVSFALSSLACDSIAIWMAPKKVAKSNDTQAAHDAREQFWEVFGRGDYAQVDAVISRLTGVYLDNPLDPQIATLLGHSHFWKFAERERTTSDATITDELILADRYFSEAWKLRPDDRRMYQWVGGIRMVLGQIHRDEALTREGYFKVVHGATHYAPWNLVGASFPFSLAPTTQDVFALAERYLWESLEGCAQAPIDRFSPDLSALLDGDFPPREAAEICHNAARYPHNLEGMLLNLGDIVAKKGDQEGARRAYELTRVSPDYDLWPYKGELEKRLDSLADRVTRHSDSDVDNDPTMMASSHFACTGCHQGS